MSRKLLSLKALAAAFTLVLGTVELQAGHCRSQSSSRNCCQASNYSHSIFSIFDRCDTGTQRQVYYSSRRQRRQPTWYVSTNAHCNPQPACCVVQTACQNVQAGYAVPEIQTSSPAPSPPLDYAPPPAPGRLSAPSADSAPAPALTPALDSTPAPIPAPDSAPTPSPAPGR